MATPPQATPPTSVESPPLLNNSDRMSNKAKKLHSLVDDELIASVAWLTRLRWFAGLGVVFASWLIKIVFKFQAPYATLSAIGASILFYNLLFFLIERHLIQTSAPVRSYRWLAMCQVGLDWLAMTLLIHFSGGIESPAILFFIFHIIIASILFSPRTAYAFTCLAILFVSSIALLEHFSLLTHRPIIGYLEFPLYQNNYYVAAVLVFFSSTGLIAAFLTSAIQERLRRREEEVVMLTESLQRATDRLQALNDGARTVSSTLELPQVLNRLVKNTADVMGVFACSIRLLDNTGQRLEPEASYGLSQTYLDKGPVEIENNPLARQVLSGHIINVPDVSKSSLLQYPDWAEQEGIRSMLSAPLLGKDGPLGIIRAYSEKSNHFTANDESFLAAIAAQGSIAIENAMAYQVIANLDATKTTFIRTVTHELRSPVSVTRSLLRTITDGYAGQLNEQQRDILERANRRIDFLQKLIDDLLDLAAGKVEVPSKQILEPIVLDEIIQKVITRFEVPARVKGVSLECHKETIDRPTILHATIDGLDRIFDNLVGNAVKYTLTNGKVSINLSHNNGEAWVTIEDTGIGISEESLSHLFEEFYRAPNARALEREGTGLGLTIVKNLVTRFGGRLAVQSTQGIGTRFTVILPFDTSLTSLPAQT